jgi:sucrose-6-phosphate hydrolase SacC (GH32 family)
MIFHSEVLTQRQLLALRQIGAFTADQGFYLGGGTAIALQFGHRRSVDFDWFRQSPIPDPLTLSSEIQDQEIPFVTGWTERNTLYGTIGGVRTSFFQFRYELLDPVLLWPEMGCRLASLRDLACMKLSAIAQRGSRKDFVDLYALGRHGFALGEMVHWYRDKFEVTDIGHLLYALVYFDDADSEKMPTMIWKLNWREIKRTVQDWVKAYSLNPGSS